MMDERIFGVWLTSVDGILDNLREGYVNQERVGMSYLSQARNTLMAKKSPRASFSKLINYAGVMMFPLNQ